MVIINTECKDCIHKNVCGSRAYLEQYVNAHKAVTVENMPTITSSMFDYNITCKEYMRDSRPREAFTNNIGNTTRGFGLGVSLEK